MLKWFEKALIVYKRSMEIMAWAAGFATVILMFLVAYDVVMRYVMARASTWITDVSYEFFMVFLAFIPAAWILLVGGHVNVTLLVDRLESKWRRIMTRLTDALALGYTVILVWQGWLLMWDNLVSGYAFSTTSGLLRWPAYAFVVIGGVLLCIGFIMRLAGEFLLPQYDLGRPYFGDQPDGNEGS